MFRGHIGYSWSRGLFCYQVLVLLCSQDLLGFLGITIIEVEKDLYVSSPSLIPIHLMLLMNSVNKSFESKTLIQVCLLY